MPPLTRGTTCNKCGDKISNYDDILICVGECKGAYHIKCVSVTVEAYSAMNMKNEIDLWKCYICENTITNKSNVDCFETAPSVIFDNTTRSCQGMNLENTINLVNNDERLEFIIQNQLIMSKQIEQLTTKLTEALELIHNKNQRIEQLENKLIANEKSKPPQSEIEQYSHKVKNQSKIIRENLQKNVNHPINAGQSAKLQTTPIVLKETNKLPLQVNTPENRLPNKSIEKQINLTQSAGNRQVTGIAEDYKSDDDFTTVNYKKKKSTKIVRGTGGGDAGLSCIESRIWIYLGRCSPNSTTENVTSHLKAKYPNHEFDIKDLEGKGYFKSFRIGASMELQDALYDSNTWPKGALIKQFLFRRSGVEFKNTGTD